MVETYHFQVGDFRCIAVSDGSEVTPAEGVVKGVPLEVWRQALQESGYSTTEAVTYFNNLFIRAGEHRVLIDAGWGEGNERRKGTLLEGLAAEGVAPADIDTLVITHSDVDHIGGIAGADGRLIFPNARYVVPKNAWDFWSNEPLVARWPEFLTACGRRIWPLIRDRLEVVEAGSEFVPGFRLIPAPGHRPGHCAVAVSSEGEHLLHIADVVGHPVLMEHPSWTWAFDANPEQAQKDKATILGQAVAEQALVFASHLPFPGVGHVVPQGDGWRWQPLVEGEH